LHSSRKVQTTAFPARRPLYYYVTDRRLLRPQDFRSRVRGLIRWGIDFIQIREKHLDDRDLFLLARNVVADARSTGCRILVNGRADVALAAGAHGVHLPSSGLRPDDLRPWLPDGFLVGVSVHSEDEAVRAWTCGADYVLAGPINATPSKAGMGPPLGIARFRGICTSVPVPVLGLGGIDAGTVEAVLDAGAAGVAAIRLFQEGSEIDFREGRKFRTP
jgi:thiamine-phosphate pyrophosphorylase